MGCISSLLPLQIVDGCYAAFHCRSTLCHPSSHLYAGVNRDISEQLLLPLCPGSERTATPRPRRIEEGNFPGPPCSDSHTHVCMSPQLVSILPVLFACLAQGVAPRIFCSPCLSSRGKVGHSDPVYCWMPTGRWLGLRRVMTPQGPSSRQGIRAPDWHP